MELLEVVSNPESWKTNLRSTVWIFWDHSAAWLKSTSGQVTMSEAERQAKQLRQRSSRLNRSARTRAEGEALAAAQSEKSQNPTQTRGVSDGSDQAFRLTLIFSRVSRVGSTRVPSREGTAE